MARGLLLEEDESTLGMPRFRTETRAGSAAPSGLNISADRPFLYLLRDQPTGAVIFMGRVLDPSKS